MVFSVFGLALDTTLVDDFVVVMVLVVDDFLMIMCVVSFNLLDNDLGANGFFLSDGDDDLEDGRFNGCNGCCCCFS